MRSAQYQATVGLVRAAPRRMGGAIVNHGNRETGPVAGYVAVAVILALLLIA